MKHRGQKKFRFRPRETVTQEAERSLKTKSMLRLDNATMAKYQKEYKQSMYKSQYGLSFGRNETDLADTGILKYK